MDEFAMQPLRLFEIVRVAALPLRDCRQVLGLPLVGESHFAAFEVPLEANMGDVGSERDIFGSFPWNSQFLAECVDIGHGVGVT